jgi:hypothetical protein
VAKAHKSYVITAFYHMKIFGITLLVIAAIALLIGFNLETTIATEFEGHRVHNIGLMNDKQNVIVIAGFLATIGAIFFVFASRSDAMRTNSMTDTANTRQCPYCAEQIRTEAVVCRFCQRDLPSSDVALASARAAARRAAELATLDGGANTAIQNQTGLCPSCYALVSIDSLTRL